ncbi:unnamed protein product [Chrysodeixis includens]|uniref:UDP-glucuronosyltransferase n=1 Tax=Chrysodeixis includens TaxID=689277 RepID=A0A9N8KUN9_CHRIL|nr:unnamed protein product [Chrysodeixis includens]
MHFLLIVFTIFAGACESYRILALLPYTGKSHFMVFEPIVDELARRGHHVTVVSFFPSATPRENRRDVSLVGVAPLNVEVMDLKNYDDASFFARKFYNQFVLVTDLIKFNLDICERILKADVFNEFLKAQGDYDVILVEHFNTDCMQGIVHNYGVPSIGLMSCALLPWGPDRVGADMNPAKFPSMLLPLTEDMTFFELVENTFNMYFYLYWHKYLIRDEQTLLEENVGHKLPPLGDISSNASVILVNTHHTLNGVRVLPPSVVEVGGVHLHNKTVKALPEHLEQWVSQSKHGFILLSFGSLIRGSSLPPKRFDAILRIFALLPQRIIWKWETDDIKDLPENVMVLKWLPQYDLLNHPNCVAFITHAGLLSLTEAVAAGVPMVVVPVLGDQPGNAAYAKQAGIAESVPFYDLDENTLNDALLKVLTPEMRARAKAFSKVWSERPLSPMDTAIYHIEYTARHKGFHLLSRRHDYSTELCVLKYGILSVFSTIIFVIVSSCFGTNKVKVKQS